MLPWSAETALNEFWATHDATKTNGDVRKHIKAALQAAFDAGYQKGVAAAEYDDTNATP